MSSIKITHFPKLDYACNEAMNTLCTNLFYCGDNIRTVLVTSRHEQEGKSSVSINMMRTIASCGKRVVLVDADLRCSVLGSRYRFAYDKDGGNGLAEYLAGMCPLDTVLYETNLDNAYIIPAGREVLNSLQLLSSPRYKDMIAALRAHFDVVLVDSPPAGIIVDAIEIAKYCDGALLVVACNTGSKQEIDEVAKNIRKTGCKVLGAVLNNVNFNSFQNRKYYYRSGKYSSYYHYGQRNNRNAPKKR
ncbi:MAG: CpsD/CapB family tyrosine-protein kinase [Clostridia bacterium]|nr:CpsD/CapB family tyrosine-protein kinase [Clostridia bacterium]